MAQATATFYGGLSAQDVDSNSRLDQRSNSLPAGSAPPASQLASAVQASSPYFTLRNHRQSSSFNINLLRSPKDVEREMLKEQLRNWETPITPSAKSNVQPYDALLNSPDAHWTSVVSKEAAVQLTKRQVAQQEAIWELLVTEYKHINYLQVMLNRFVFAVSGLNREYPWFMVDEKKLFGNIDLIHKANSEMWQMHFSKLLDQAQSTGLPLNAGLLEQGFLQVRNIFASYLDYCSQYHTFSDYLRRTMDENEHFRTLVEWWEEQDYCERLQLTDWIMKPVQRLMKYPSLIRAILKKTDKSERHYGALGRMLTSMEAFVQLINNNIRDSEEQAKLDSVYHRIIAYDIFDSVSEEINNALQQHVIWNDKLSASSGPSPRLFLREFAVKIKSADGLRKTESTLFLFSDMILICRKSAKSKNNNKKLKIFKPTMRLSRVRFHRLRETGSCLLVLIDDLYMAVDASVVFFSNPAQLESFRDCFEKAVNAFANEVRPTIEASTELDTSTDLCDSKQESPDFSEDELRVSETPDFIDGANEPTPSLFIPRDHTTGDRRTKSFDLNNNEQPVILEANLAAESPTSENSDVLSTALSPAFYAKYYPDVQQSLWQSTQLIKEASSSEASTSNNEKPDDLLTASPSLNSPDRQISPTESFRYFTDVDVDDPDAPADDETYGTLPGAYKPRTTILQIKDSIKVMRKGAFYRKPKHWPGKHKRHQTDLVLYSKTEALPTDGFNRRQTWTNGDGLSVGSENISPVSFSLLALDNPGRPSSCASSGISVSSRRSSPDEEESKIDLNVEEVQEAEEEDEDFDDLQPTAFVSIPVSGETADDDSGNECYDGTEIDRGVDVHSPEEGGVFLRQPSVDLRDLALMSEEVTYV